MRCAPDEPNIALFMVLSSVAERGEGSFGDVAPSAQCLDQDADGQGFVDDSSPWARHRGVTHPLPTAPLRIGDRRHGQSVDNPASAVPCANVGCGPPHRCRAWAPARVQTWPDSRGVSAGPAPNRTSPFAVKFLGGPDPLGARGGHDTHGAGTDGMQPRRLRRRRPRRPAAPAAGRDCGAVGARYADAQLTVTVPSSWRSRMPNSRSLAIHRGALRLTSSAS